MKEEIIETLESNFPELTQENLNIIVERFCVIKKPEIENNNFMGYLTINTLRNTGSSIKPGNIVLNMRKLLIDSSEITLTIAGIYATPYLIPLAALIIWNKVWSNIKIDLEESHAMTIKLMWENRDIERNWIEENKAFELYNEYLISKNRNVIFIEDFRHILGDLERMKCIELTNGKIWWLRECVKKSI